MAGIQESIWGRFSVSRSARRRLGCVLGVIGFFVFGSATARADQVTEYLQKGPQKTQVKRKCTTDQKQDQHGNVLCRYYQANDNLILQALYLTEKLKRVDDAIKAKQESDALTALGAFCRASESASQCYPRYQAFQALALARVRQAIGTNEDTIARLTTNRQLDGSVSGPAYQIDSELKSEAYVPDVPRMSDLESEFKQSGRIAQKKKVSHGEVLKWSQELVNPDPRSKFTEFKSAKVRANPHQENSTELLNMIERDPSGAQKTDLKVRELANEKRDELQDSIKSAKKSDQNYEVEVISPLELKKDKLSYESIQEARTVMVGTLNTELAKKSGTAQANAVDIKNSGIPGAVRTVGDEEKVLIPPTNSTHTYIKYDLNTLFKEIGTLTQ